ncbi:hypothetical protein [Sulfuracidifex metallicus]|uniref:hypothetical protein n=1 Tax=Sulfuracidifex metallicus TaxID=47303 RepID=UPI002274DAC7|nr:hypothetical protein [Sulfuracidifex metallicus]MCY0850667.1 hypothetical protein [Sulfuracidifex metallicus]
MLILEEILLVIGLLMFPYGIYEIMKGDGSLKTKLSIIGTSAALFLVEALLTIK